MFSFLNALRVPELRKRLAFTFFVLAVYRVGSFVPVPGVGAGMTQDANWPKFIDELLPPYHLEDAEGWLSTLPACASCLLGVFAMLIL